MAYTKWQMAKIQAQLRKIAKEHPGFFDSDDEEEGGHPYRISARKNVSVTSVEVKRPSYYSVCVEYIKRYLKCTP